MKATVLQELCIGCGICESICPAVFAIGADGKASVKVDPLTAPLVECAKDAQGQCPVTAINLSATSGRDEQ